MNLLLGRSTARVFRTAITAAVIAVVLAGQVEGQFPPPGVATASSPELSLRYAAKATREQVVAVRNSAGAWARFASSRNYRADQFQSDFHTMQLQLSALAERFNWMAGLAIQSGRPRAQNAVAELGAGLNLIGELLYFLEQQYAAGLLDQATIVCTCRAFESAAREWEIEFKKSSARMGIIY